MDEVANLPESDRRDLFNTVATERGDMSPLIVEKDFWVCWCLKHLFSTERNVGMIFKGGTSLSKAYGLLHRFSEDVDLSLDRKALGFTHDREPSQAASGKRTRKLLDELSSACEAFVAVTLLPAFRIQIESVLPPVGRDASWSLSVDDNEKKTLLFAYPAALPTGSSGYVHQTVRLEFGGRSDHWPSESRTVTPYAAETLPQAFAESSCAVHVLVAERTFWEKATILHTLYHKPLDRPLVPRQSRHYSDLAVMADAETGKTALERLDLLEAVTRHKAVFFRSAWAQYETAKPGTLRLLPPDERRNELKRDYQAMTEMFFDEPLTFDDVLSRLQALERKINEC